ncbi:MAG TPA: hypothetical protein EYP04_12560 [Anaerolineae bacterium]|nr:hypothetical protein [Anaerolineae bacterium]HIQ05182.1 hypothetical protein [Anaerolineae bacterium]
MAGRFVALMLFVLALMTVGLSQAEAAEGTSSVGFRLLYADERGLQFEFALANDILPRLVEGELSDRYIDVPGLVWPDKPDQFTLPFAAILIGIPPDATPIIAVLHDEFEDVPLPQALRWSDQTPKLAAITHTGWLRDQRIARVVLHPLEPRAESRTLRVHSRLRVAVRFAAARHPQPVWRWQAASTSPFESVLRQVLLNYELARTWRTSSEPGSRGAVKRTSTAVWASTPRCKAFSGAGFVGSSLSPFPRLKLVVDADGIYRITPADLAAVGWDVGRLDPRTLRLCSQGRGVAIFVHGEADGHFDPGDFVEFYGRRRFGGDMFTKYSDDNVYWLETGDGPGLRMEQRDVSPSPADPTPTAFWTTHRAERNLEWFTHHALDWPTRDTWWWSRLIVGSASGSVALTTTLPAAASEPFTATLAAEIGTWREAGTHHIQLRWNQVPDPIADALFDGHQLFRLNATLPGSSLISGTNVLTFTILNDQGYRSDYLLFNHYDLTYRRRYVAEDGQLRFTVDEPGRWRLQVEGFPSSQIHLYDLTDPTRPVRLTGASVLPKDASHALAFRSSFTDTQPVYLALTQEHVRKPRAIVPYTPSGLLNPLTSADYVIITAPGFITAAQRLADYRAGQGLRTVVVDVSTLYDDFNDGFYHPDAIRNFLAYAYAHWLPPAPAYVLLLGDGNWNFKGYNPDRYGPPEPNHIPPYLAWVDPWQGEVPADNQYVTIVGDDPLPDMAIGRLSVRTPSEANVVVDKIIAYEAQQPAAWQTRLLIAADNADETGDYPAVAEDILTHHLPAAFVPSRVYLGVTYLTAADVTQAISESINSGVFMVNWLGHGSVHRWAHEPVWTTDDLSSLHNADQLPLVLTFNCLDGYFAYPNYQAMAEEMPRRSGGGSIANWSPAGLGVTWAESLLHVGIFRAVFQDGMHELGPAAIAGKLALYTGAGEDSLLHTMTLFGDPALRLPLPPPHLRHLPLVR